MKTWTHDQLSKIYTKNTSSIVAACRLSTDLLGGLPASRDGLRAFVEFQMKLTNPREIEKAVERIMLEEIGERDRTPETGELVEKTTYGVNVIRKDKYGPWIAPHMIKACFKVAASRWGMFASKGKVGLKGDVSEGGSVIAHGLSRNFNSEPNKIYVMDSRTRTPAVTQFVRIAGTPSGAHGKRSIVHDSECVPTGSRFEWEYRLIGSRVNGDDLAKIVALMMIVGLGSGRSLDYGRFSVEKLIYNDNGTGCTSK